MAPLWTGSAVACSGQCFYSCQSAISNLCGSGLKDSLLALAIFFNIPNKQVQNSGLLNLCVVTNYSPENSCTFCLCNIVRGE